MPQKKKVEDKISVKQFREGSSDFWVGNCHYNLNEDNEIVWCSGGIDSEELRAALLSFIRRNKKCFKERSPNIFETEEIDYSIVNFGKYAGKSTQHIVAENKRYANWLYQNTTDVKIKSELKILLKK